MGGVDVENLKDRIGFLPAGDPIPWIMDFDGVLNLDDRPPFPITAGDWPRYRRKGVVDGTGIAYPVVWAPDLVECINLLISFGHVDVYWLTTWGVDALLYAAPALGLVGTKGSLGEQAPHDVWWKLVIVQSFAASYPGRFFWTDDEIEENVGTGIVHSMTDRRCLALSPDGRDGLSAEHLSLIVDAIASWRRNVA